MPGLAVDLEEIRQDYFQWLCDLVHIDSGVATYWLLARDLHARPFVSLIPRDENRAMDGLDLREEYIRFTHYAEYNCLEDSPCSVLEMLIALAQRMDFELSDPDNDAVRTAGYFWEMIDNLGLSVFSDDAYVELDGVFQVQALLTRFLQRAYEPDGFGGLFPLEHTDRDQREVEIWYQMSAYIAEKYGG